MAKDGKPSWFKLYTSITPIIDAAPDEAVGQALKAVMTYMETETIPTDMEPMVSVLFQVLKIGADESINNYGRNVENGKKGGRPKKEKPPLTGETQENPEKGSVMKASKATKHTYGEYGNVLLTDEELGKLQSAYPDWQAKIDRLSAYMASKGASYKNHYATIRTWAQKDAEQAAKTETAARGGDSAGSNPFLNYVQAQEGREKP